MFVYLSNCLFTPKYNAFDPVSGQGQGTELYDHCCCFNIMNKEVANKKFPCSEKSSLIIFLPFF